MAPKNPLISDSGISDSPVGDVPTLGLLNAVHSGEASSQRALAGRLGVALGLVNALVKRCARKGLIKISQAPARRFAYYLTPEGFQEKGRLVGEYLSTSLDFFRQSRSEYEDIFSQCQRQGWKRVVLVGASELAEIASLAAMSSGVRLVGLIDPEKNEGEFCGVRVFRSIEELRSFDAVVLCDTRAPQEEYDALEGPARDERIFTPPFLHVHRDRMSDGAPEDGSEEAGA